MKNSIEQIWSEGFLNENSLVAPKVNDLYNQKSQHLVDRMIRRFSVNIIAMIIMAIVFPIVHYFLNALWQGLAASLLLLLVAWYNKIQMNGIKKLNQGATSLEYLKSLDQWLKDVLRRSEKIARFYYPLCFIIAISTIWSTWSNQEKLILKMHERFPDLLLIYNVPLVVVIVAGISTLAMFYFSDKIYRWDVRLMYGCIFGKLERTIAEMEELKQG